MAGKLPWIWPVPPSCTHPHCPPDLLGPACSCGWDLGPRAPRARLCVSFTAVPHFSQAEDQRERREGAALDPSLALSPVPLEREQGSSHVPSLCFQKLRVERSGGGARAPVAQGDKHAPSAALSGCSLTNRGRAQNQSNEVACLPRCREQWQSPRTTQQPLSTSAPRLGLPLALL